MAFIVKDWYSVQFSVICKAPLTLDIITKTANEKDRDNSGKENLTRNKHIERNQTQKGTLLLNDTR